MTTWRMIGSTSRAVRPISVLSTGTSRQPRNCLAFFGARSSSNRSFAIAPLGFSRGGRNTLPTPYSPAAGTRMPSFAGLGREKIVRNLHQNAGAVAGERIAAAGAAVSEIDENFQALTDDLVAFLAANVHDETHSAGVVLIRRVVQTFARRGSNGNCDCMVVTVPKTRCLEFRCDIVLNRLLFSYSLREVQTFAPRSQTSAAADSIFDPAQVSLPCGSQLTAAV